MKYRILPLLFLVTFSLLLPFLAYADIPDISVSEISGISSIMRGELGNYILKVSNEGSAFQKLQLAADPNVGLSSSYFEYVFIEPNYLELNAHESAEINVTIKLKSIVDPGIFYPTQIILKSITDTSLSEKYALEIYMIKPEDFAKLSLSLPEIVVPGSEIEASVNIKNNINRPLSNVQIYLSSEIFDERKDIQLFALQERTEDFLFQTSPLASPGDYPVNLRMYYKGELVQTISDLFAISSTADMQEDKEEVKGFLVRTLKVTKTNKGNTAVSDFYAAPVSSFAKWFTEFEPAPSSYDEYGNPIWSFTLNPEASHIVQIKTDYRPLAVVVVLVVLFAGMIVYWFFRGLSITKKVFRIKQTPEGISEIRVLLHIKNNSRGSASELMVIDMLPNIMHPHPNFGTLKPDEVQEGSHGIRMIWKISELVKGEERILSYVVGTKFKFTGQLQLPPAQLRFKTKERKVTAIHSNRVLVRSMRE